MLDLARITNPILDRRPSAFLRDPAIHYHAGVLRCFHTTVEETQGTRRLFLDLSVTRDFVTWTTTRLTQSALNFSSPGNLIQVGQRWHLCVQSYPITPGELWGNDQARLWLLSSDDLEHWSEPRVLAADGCACDWAPGPRQIDPYLVCHEGEYYCFYKANGCLGAITSPDLAQWRELSPRAPLFSPSQTPDRRAVENPCIIRAPDGRYRLFFSPCRPGRGVGMAESSDLRHWEKVRYLDLPLLPWAKNGPTAAAVVDARAELGYWLMLFHGEDLAQGHSAALGLAYSEDLVTWRVP